MCTMYDYIIRQPEILQSVLDRKESWIGVFGSLLENRPIQRVVYTGSGTSQHVSQAAAMLTEKYLPLDARACLPALLAGGKIRKPQETLVVGISQSGNSISTLQALDHAKKQGCATLTFSLEADSPLVNLCDAWMPLVCQRELVPPETQGYTAAILEWILAIRHAAGFSTDVTDEIAALPDVIRQAEGFVQEHLPELLQAPKITVTGSGLHWVTAMEGALKMRECLRKAVMREETEELSHLADLAFNQDDLLVAVMQTDRDAQTVELVLQITDHVLVLEAGGQDLDLIRMVIPFQLAAALGACRLGIDTSRYPYDIENISHSEKFLFRESSRK